MSQKKIFTCLSTLLVALISSHAVCDFPKYDPYGLDSTLQGRYRKNLDEHQLPWPDVFETTIYPRGKPLLEIPTSNWIKQEKELFAGLLKQQQFDILIVPFQTQHFGIDRIGRSIMTAELAYHADRLSKLKIPDPYLVSRALGEGFRTYKTSEILQFATSLGVKKIINGFVGHDRKNKLKLTIQIYEREIDSQTWTAKVKMRQFDWSDLHFSDTLLPIQVFRKKIPEIIESTNLAEWVPEKHLVSEQSKNIENLVNPHKIATQPDLANINKAQILSLMAILSPSRPSRAAERIFEKVLLLANQIEDESEYTQILKARALFHLNRRPAALKYIEGIDSPEANSLRDLLNGNISSLVALTANVKSPIDRLILMLESNNLSILYSGNPLFNIESILQQINLEKETWQELVRHKYNEINYFRVHDNSIVKNLLDISYPIDGYSLKDIIAGDVVLGKNTISSNNFALSPIKHINKLLSKSNDMQCCLQANYNADTWHYIQLLEAVAASNLLKNIENIAFVQGHLDRGRQMLDSYETLYSGHPEFLIMRAKILISQARKSKPENSNLLIQQYRNSAITASFLEQGQSLVSRDALTILGIPSKHSNPFNDAYIRDFPIRSYWNPYETKTKNNQMFLERNSFAALKYSSNDLTPAKRLLEIKSKNDLKKLVSVEVNGRFSGNPMLVQIEPQIGNTIQNINSVEAAYRQAINDQPNVSDHYKNLGIFLIESNGDYYQAADVFLSNPILYEDSDQNSVLLSNYAYSVGSKLFLRGYPELAKPLYQLAASRKNGSYASMSAHDRLLILDRDYINAAKGSLQRAQRYDNVYAFRDYLKLLHVTGYSEAAWAGFNQLATRYKNPQIWVSAHVGHRFSQQSFDEFRKWLDQDHIRGAIYENIKFSSGYVILWNSVDRFPHPDFVTLLSNVEGPPNNIIDVDGISVLRPVGDPSKKFREIIRPSKFRINQRPKSKPDSKIKSDFELFSEAYVLVRNEKYKDAVFAFDKLAAHYPIESSELGFALPYFAFASAKSGDPLKLENFLDNLPNNENKFDIELAKAFFAGLKNESNAAIQHLNRAFNNRPNTDARPIFTEYQFAEACIWLFKETKNDSYKKLAIDWAKKHQKIRPTISWAYSLEAAYSNNRDDRVEAAAITLYLDKQSEWLKLVPKDILNDGKIWLEKNNPFLNIVDIAVDKTGI